jgi:hypothetical protein
MAHSCRLSCPSDRNLSRQDLLGDEDLIGTEARGRNIIWQTWPYFLLIFLDQTKPTHNNAVSRISRLQRKVNKRRGEKGDTENPQSPATLLFARFLFFLSGPSERLVW